MDTPVEHRKAYVAMVLGYDPTDQETWDKAIIDSVIAHAARAADYQFDADIRALLHARF